MGKKTTRQRKNAAAPTKVPTPVPVPVPKPAGAGANAKPNNKNNSNKSKKAAAKTKQPTPASGVGAGPSSVETQKKTPGGGGGGGGSGKQNFSCANCKTILETPPEDEIRGNLVQVSCHKCDTPNFLQYHCWACRTPLDGIDYNAKGVQGQCPECGAFNPAKKPRVKDSWDDCSNRCVDRIMFGFTAFVQPYCVYAQCMWIYPYVLSSMGAHGGTLEKVLYGITLFVSAGTLFNYWSGVFTPIKLHRTPAREEVALKSHPETKDRLNLNRYHFCAACRAPRAPRDHHCNICRTCVPVMDHHCPFYGGSCVGRHNHRNFILFLLYMMLTTVWLATSTVACFKHLPGFPGWVFKREFSKKIMTACAGSHPFCPMQYIWSFPEVSMFGVVVIQLLLTVLTLILVSVLFQQQVTDLMESRTRLEGIIAKSKKKKRDAALAAGEAVEDHDGDDGDDHHHDHEEDEEANKWGELRDVCGPGHGVLSWVLTPFVGTLPSKLPQLKKKEL